MEMTALVHACKVTIARAITHPAVGGLIAKMGRDRIRSHGLWIDVSDPLISPSVKAQLFWNLYEGAELRFVRRFLKGQKAVIDLGGSLGIAALHALDVMDPLGELVTVEAHPALAAALRSRFRKYPNVHVVHAAIAYGTQGKVQLLVAESSTCSRLQGQSERGGVAVPARTLAEIVSGAGFQRFALISDIEGAELAVLENDGAVLQRCDLAVVELHEVDDGERRATVEDLYARFCQLGFRILAERGPVVVLSR